MSGHSLHPVEPKGRKVGTIENSWCRAVSSGTGITLLAILGSKAPDFEELKNALHKIQNSQPILKSKLHHNAASNTFSLIVPSTPNLNINSLDSSSTSRLLRTLSSNNNDGSRNSGLSPFHLILENELNDAVWSGHANLTSLGTDLLFATLYALPEGKYVLVLRLHTVACDRTTAVTLLRELRGLMGGGEGRERRGMLGKDEGEVSLGIEELIPKGNCKGGMIKSVWAHGMNMLSYSVNSLRQTNLKFINTKAIRRSEVVRLQMNPTDTQNLLLGCKTRGIKLFGALAAAGLIAAHSSKRRSDQQKKYSVVTLTDCRSILDPPLSDHHFGFYHTAIVNTHSVREGDKLWELATKSYMAVESSKSNNKHLSDMADLNFLMCKAIENPSLTSSSSLRSSLITVFEDPVIDNAGEVDEGLGLEDYMGCASLHGVGPSIGIFDTIRDGRLDCVCVYPSPLHSRDQMEELVLNMKKILSEG